MNALESESNGRDLEPGKAKEGSAVKTMRRLANCLLAAGVCGFLVTAVSGLSGTKILGEGIRVKGVVVRHDEAGQKAKEQGSPNEGQTWYSVVEFEDYTGKKQEARTSASDAPPKYKIGDTVEVAYLKERPDRGRIASNWEFFGRAIMAGVVSNLLFFGGACILGGIALLERIDRGRAQTVARPLEYRLLCLAFVLWGGLAIAAGGLRWANPSYPSDFSGVPDIGVLSLVAAVALWWPWRIGRTLAWLISVYWIVVAVPIFLQAFPMLRIRMTPEVDLTRFGPLIVLRILIVPFLAAQFWQLKVLGRPEVRVLFVDRG